MAHRPNAELAAGVAERILQQLQTPFRVGGDLVSVDVSIGTAGLVSGQETAAELLRNADLALHTAKAEGKARYKLYEPSMQARGMALDAA